MQTAILAAHICLQDQHSAPYWIFHQSDFPGNTFRPLGLIYLLIAPKDDGGGGLAASFTEGDMYLLILCTLYSERSEFLAILLIF